MVSPRKATPDDAFEQARRDLSNWVEQGRHLLASAQLQVTGSATELAANQRGTSVPTADPQALRNELQTLRGELESLEIAHFELVCRNLGTLRLHTCDSVGDVLDALVEIALNFLGVGAFALYLADAKTQTLYAVAHEGMDREQAEQWDAQAMAASLAQLEWPSDELLIPLADEIGVLPLIAQERVVGAIRLVHAFPQKNALTDADREFLTLLSEHGAIALRRAWIISTCEDSWWTPTSLKALLDS